jgi:hypothetical protein
MSGLIREDPLTKLLAHHAQQTRALRQHRARGRRLLVLHESWCLVFRGGPCCCNPDTEVTEPVECVTPGDARDLQPAPET